MATVQFKLGESEPYKDSYLQFFPNANFSSNDYIERFKVQVQCINSANHSHGDKHSSAFFSTRTGVYYCSACVINVSFQNFLIQVIGYDVQEALRITSDIKGNETIMPKFDEYEKTYFSGTNELTKYVDEARSKLNPYLDIVKEYMTARGLTYETLVKAKVGYVPEVVGEDGRVLQMECLAFPYYLNNKVVAVRGRTFDGRKGGIKGSRFVPYNASECKENIVIVEGESDTLRMQQLLDTNNLDYTAIGVPSATFRQEFLRELEGVKRVVIIPQDDTPSITFANMAYSVVTKGLTKDCTILPLKFKQGDGGKDVCDYLFQHTEDELITRLPVIMKNNNSRWYSQKEMLEVKADDIDWIIPNFIARGEKIIVGGEQKSMKTYFTMFLIRSAVEQNAFLDIDGLKPKRAVKVLFVEEEGGRDKFALRIKQVFKDVDNSNIFYRHKYGLRLDTKANFEDLEEKIKEFQPDLLVLDPLQRMHLKDEDSASEMAEVWNNIHELTMKYPYMSIIIVQHFRKGGSTLNYWDSLRGSNRGAGEADIGIFVRKEQEKMQKNTILSIRFDGRDANPFEEISNESDEFKIAIDTNLWEMHLLKQAPIDVDKMQQEGIRVNTTAEAVIYRALEKGHLTSDELAEKTHIPKTQIRTILKQDNGLLFTTIKLQDDKGAAKFYNILVTNKESYRVSVRGLEDAPVDTAQAS